MLTVQPISYSNRKSIQPAFKGWDKDSIEEDKNFFTRQKEEIDEIINDDYVPEGMKKPLKFFSMAANAAVSGLAVFGSALAISAFFKKTGAKFVSNETLQKGINKAKPIAEKLSKFTKDLGNKILAGLNLLKETKFGKNVSNLYEKFTKTPFGKKFAEYADKTLSKVSELTKKVLTPVKKVTYDKVSTATAAVLGTGSGLAGGYQEYIKESPAHPAEEEY